jgi:hypothetical protein
MMLPVVLYGCDAWSLTLREEHRLREFQISVLRRIFVSKRDEVTCVSKCPINAINALSLHSKSLNDKHVQIRQNLEPRVLRVDLPLLGLDNLPDLEELESKLNADYAKLEDSGLSKA